MKKKPHIVRWIFIGILLLFPALLIYSCILSQKLSISAYTLEAPIHSPIRIVQLTDLHNAEFGEGNGKLVELVRQQSPDLIVMTGDMLNRDDEDLHVVCALIEELSGIAPVYYGYGNHETDWEEAWYRELHPELTSAGAIVLNNEYLDVGVNGNELRIAGYMGYYGQPHMLTGDKEQQKLERAFYAEFQDTSRYKILLNHIPTQWLDWEYINKFPVDLVFSGHFHGGVIRIPIINRGLYAPYIGWFSQYTKGIFTGEEATCVLSAGLGSEYHIPRLNNPPEIVLLDLIPSGGSLGLE